VPQKGKKKEKGKRKKEGRDFQWFICSRKKKEKGRRTARLL